MLLDDGRVERVIAVFGMRRSGHHAVLHQVCLELGDVTHLNNCVITKRPFEAFPRNGRFVVYGQDRIVDSGPLAHVEYRVRLSRSPATRHMLFSFEDFDIAQIDSLARLWSAGRLTVISVVRDPYNWVASSLAHSAPSICDIARRISLWKKQVFQCLRPPCGSPAFVDVDFGRWSQELDYRAGVAARLGVPFHDRGRNAVPPFGRGSSFDGLSSDGSGAELKVMDRWQAYVSDPRYQAVTQDSTVRWLSQMYFRFDPLPPASVRNADPRDRSGC